MADLTVSEIAYVKGDFGPTEVDFVQSFNDMRDRVHQWSRDKGFWKHEDQILGMLEDCKRAQFEDGGSYGNDVIDAAKTRLKLMQLLEKVALTGGELGEFAEGLRTGNPPCDKPGLEEFSNAEEETADTIIRLLDIAGRMKMRIGEAIARKMRMNDCRQHMHGKKA